MKKPYSIGAISVLFLLFFVSPLKGQYEAQAQIVIEPEPVSTLAVISTTTIRYVLIPQYAAKYGVKESVLENTVGCETKWTFDPTVQSFISSTSGPNGRENSWGLPQWDLDYKNTNQDGTVITKEEATTATTSLNVMAWYFSTGREDLWSCYKKIYGVK